MDGRVEEAALLELSVDDAEDLQAFLERRRWFEGKLQVSQDHTYCSDEQIFEALTPIHPFTQSELGEKQTCESFDPSIAPWCLPTINQVERWQRERDDLEEEVLAFDGGSLGRMKVKIRGSSSQVERFHVLIPVQL